MNASGYYGDLTPFERNGSISDSTFDVEVLADITVKYPLRTSRILRLKLLFDNNQSHVCEIPADDLKRINWNQVDRRCVINPMFRGAKKRIETNILCDAANAPSITKYGFDTLGINRIGDKICYVAGRKAYTRSFDNFFPEDFIVSDSKFRLDTDPAITPKEAYSGMCELVKISPTVGGVLFAYSVAGILTTAFKEIGFSPSTVLMVVGESGMYKSQYVPLIVKLYNRSDDLKADTRFNSTPRFIEEILSECSDFTMVVDDLHTAQSKAIKRIISATAEEINRRVSDNMGRGRMNGKQLVQKSFSGNVVFIGEYEIGTQSTTARFLNVHLDKRPDGTVLDKYQREKPLLMSTLYGFFIQWYVDNYEEICSTISKELTLFRSKTQNSETHGRLADTFFYLTTSYKVFLEFCIMSNLITPEGAKEDDRKFCSIVSQLVKEQQDRFDPADKLSEGKCYLEAIKEQLVAPNGLRIAKNRKHFKFEQFDGLLYKDCICIRKESLYRALHERIPNYSHRRLAEILRSVGVLKLDSEGKNPQVVEKHRFVCIYASKLK